MKPINAPVFEQWLHDHDVYDQAVQWAAQMRQTGEHTLKTDPQSFQAVWDGIKTFEIRLNDRGFKVGDSLYLIETTHTGEEVAAGAPLEYTGRQAYRRVSHVLEGYGLQPGWCCLSFASGPLKNATRLPQSAPDADAHRVRHAGDSWLGGV